MKKLLFTFAFITLCNQALSRSILINVSTLFQQYHKVLDVQIIHYTDSFMTCIDLKTSDTIQVVCPTKYITSYKDPQSWEGTWPNIGEQVIMITHFITTERVLFARKQPSGTYRFWDPRSIPFANTVFEIPWLSDFKPVAYCDILSTALLHQTCSDGFICSSKKLDQMRAYSASHKAFE